MEQFFTRLVTHTFANAQNHLLTYLLRDSEKADWILMGGTTLAKHFLVDDPDEKHIIHLRFHGGKNMWMCEDEHWSRFVSHPRNDYFGRLTTMMAKFEQLSGQKLQEVTWTKLGEGIFHHSAEGIRSGNVSANPWGLEEGAVYGYFDKRNGRARKYLAVRVGPGPINRVEFKPVNDPADCQETFDPSLIMAQMIASGCGGQFRLMEPAPQAPGEVDAHLRLRDELNGPASFGDTLPKTYFSGGDLDPEGVDGQGSDGNSASDLADGPQPS